MTLWNIVDGSETLLGRCGSSDSPDGRWRHYLPVAAFSPDGSVLATADPSAPATVKFWDTKYWRPFQTLTLRGREERRWPLLSVGRMEFSPDGKWFAAWGRSEVDGEVVVWNVADVLHDPPSEKSAANE